jgi:hypothetical protein
MVVTSMKWLTTLTVITMVTSVALAGCGRSAPIGSGTIPTSPSTTLAGPREWKTATYGKVAISVPMSWVVEHDTNCPDAQAPGTILLGFPKVLENCPALPASISYVAVVTLPPGASHGPPSGGFAPKSINGVPVYPGSRLDGSYDWAVPSLEVEVSGTGQDADRILRTLRRS